MQLPDIATLKGAIERLVANTASAEDRVQVQAALAAGILSMATGERAVAVGGDANGAVIMTGDGNVVLRIDASAAAARFMESVHLELTTIIEEVGKSGRHIDRLLSHNELPVLNLNKFLQSEANDVLGAFRRFVYSRRW